MTDTQLLLDRARAMCSPPTDYALAKRLGVTPSRMSNWRRAIATPDNEIAWKVAKLLGLPITDVIAYFEKDRATSPEKRAFWDAQLPRVLSAFAIAVALNSSATGGPLNAEGSSPSLTNAVLQPIYYAKYKLKAWLAQTTRLICAQGTRQLHLQAA